MLKEIQTLNDYPYNAVVHLEVSFPAGSIYRGTGALVGRNDVLTATHMLYNPDYGGWATGIDFYFGADYNAREDRYESGTLLNQGNYRWEANAWPGGVYQDDDTQGMTLSEVQSDVALIGLDIPVGDDRGWFALSPGYDRPQWAYQIGYPDGSTGMMLGRALINKESGYEVYSGYYRQGTDIMGKGSSGGPLFVYENGVPTIIGVKSAGTDTSSFWADIGLHYHELTQLIAGNDGMLPPRYAASTDGDDIFYATNAPDAFDGGAGRDTLIYKGYHGDFQFNLGGDYTRIISRSDPADVDTLISIERAAFWDGTMALDVGAGETAGSAYRLYQAAFDRTPDTAGLSYWISAMDKGMSLGEVASYFTKSPEFIGIYGSAPSNEQLLTGYYNNVLDRDPDASGKAYWLEKMQQGLPNSEVLAYFSESPENQIKLQGVLENGIWLEGQYV